MKTDTVYINEGGNSQMSEIGLEKLLKLAKVGNSEAFGELYTLYFEKVFKYLFYRVSHKETAEDLAEEVFVKAFQKLEGFQGNTKSFLGWLMVITRNLLVDHYRKKDLVLPIDEYVEVLPDVAGNVVDELTASEAQKELLEEIAKLQGLQREVLVMRFLEGYEVGQVARMLGISQGNVRILQFRALKKLKELLKKK